MKALRIVGLVMIAALGVDAQAAARPAWFQGWLKERQPEGSTEADVRDAVRSHLAEGGQPQEGALRIEVQFEVVDRESGKPIAEALFFLDAHATLLFADAKGHAGPTTVPLADTDPSLWVWVYAPGYRAALVAARPFDDTTRVALIPDTRRVFAGRVLGPDGQPAPGVAVVFPSTATHEEVEPEVVYHGKAYRVDVELAEADDSGALVVTTDDEGRFLVKLHAEGALKVRASLPNVGYAELESAPGATLELTLAPQGGITVAGVVVAKDGTPIAGLEVSDEFSAASLSTQADGRFEFRYCIREAVYFDFGEAFAESLYWGASAYQDQNWSSLRVVEEELQDRGEWGDEDGK
ncbi:MAG: hypothetical protein R3F62_21050 [Planctomycetota bacterium]